MLRLNNRTERGLVTWLKKVRPRGNGRSLTLATSYGEGTAESSHPRTKTCPWGPRIKACASCVLSLNEDGTLGYPRYILTSFATLHVTSNSKGLFHLAGGSAETSTTMDEFPRTTTPRKGGTVVCARHSKGRARLRIEGCRAMLRRLSARPGFLAKLAGPAV